MSSHSLLSRKNLALVLAAAFFSTTCPGFAASPAADCVGVATLEPNGLLRGWAGAEAELFRLDLPSAGIAVLDVMTPRVDDNPVRLDFMNGCGETSSREITIVERSASHLVLAVRQPGTWWLRAVTRGPGRYKLVTGFTAAEVREETFTAEELSGEGRLRVRRTSFWASSDVPSKNEPETVDPDPDTLTTGSAPLLRLVRLGDGEVEYLVHYAGVRNPSGKVETLPEHTSSW